MLTHPAKLWIINTDLEADNGYGTKMSPRNHSIPLAESQHHIINPTNPRGALDDGVEDRLHVRGRAADDAEHFGRCRLMLQGFAQLCVALLEFLEQPHVLDGDDGLVGEGFEKRDLLIGEWANFGATDHNRPDGTPSRSNGVARIVRVPDCWWRKRSFWKLGFDFGCDVMDMNRLLVDDSSTSWKSPTQWVALVHPGRHWTVVCYWFETFTFSADNHSVACIAQPRRILRNHVQHRLDVRG